MRIIHPGSSLPSTHQEQQSKCFYTNNWLVAHKGVSSGLSVHCQGLHFSILGMPISPSFPSLVWRLLHPGRPCFLWNVKTEPQKGQSRHGAEERCWTCTSVVALHPKGVSNQQLTGLLRPKAAMNAIQHKLQTYLRCHEMFYGVFFLFVTL